MSSTNGMRMTPAVTLEIKSVNTAGEFSGYGSVFGVVDSYGEQVAPGAFDRSLREHREAGTMPALLWQHDTRKPIGVWTSMREDNHGLAVEGRLTLEVEQAREAHALLREKAIRGLSIGFIPRKWQDDAETGVRELIDIDLWETSVVTFPANTAATVDHIRSAADFEQFLRKSGFARRFAARVTSGGWRNISEHAAQDADAGELIQAIYEWRKQLSNQF